ncbi:hypothetical protein D9757_014374 [Collybiopsis confluens]|uniref:Reverse transcriptase domain-containing protein n=1 Tax=Collybiopsis confluens TaxID=2823264 RepID=A0A8H5G5K6_9AGAR|nr:hypothetical protein D9757_014374 [Collybiopsis confluens]
MVSVTSAIGQSSRPSSKFSSSQFYWTLRVTSIHIVLLISMSDNVNPTTEQNAGGSSSPAQSTISDQIWQIIDRTSTDTAESSNNQQGKQSDSAESTLRRSCMALTKEFENGDISKASALLKIRALLAVADFLDNNAQSSSFEFYVDVLDTIHAELSESAGKGKVSDPTRDTVNQSSSNKREKLPDESDDDDGPHSSRPKIDIAALPWSSRTSSIQLSPELEKTRVILENFSRDPKLVKASILSQPDCPPFSSEDWENLIAGKPANFDHIFTSIHTTAVERETQKFGNVEFKFGSQVAAMATGSSLGTAISMPPSSHSLTAYPSSMHTEHISPNFSPVHLLPAIVESSTTTKPFASVYLKPADISYPILAVSTTSTSAGFKHLPGVETIDFRAPAGLVNLAVTPAVAGTKSDAQIPLAHADTHMFAENVGATVMSNPTARNQTLTRTELWYRRPRYARDLIWADDDGGLKRITLAKSSEFMLPLPRPPENEVLNDLAIKTIKENPHLFRITSPIHVHELKDLLVSHPNQRFVKSVLTGIKYGFWPWADTNDPSIPHTLDRSYPLKDPDHILFSREQRDIEISAHRFSAVFPELLPGMQSIPTVVVPKPRSNKLRLTVNHSAKPFPPNSWIDRRHVSVKLDNLHDLGAALRQMRRVYGHEKQLVVFKSDVSAAYRRLPMEPRWQIRQVVYIDGQFHVDHNNNFGNRAGGAIWGSFFALVMWIATYVLLLGDIFAYVDDAFGAELAENMTYYEPYGEFFPTKQAKFLMLLDKLGTPHERPKQLYGPNLLVIGLEVDANAMTITMPLEPPSDLIAAIKSFAVIGCRWKLREFQRIGGWTNWGLNAYPLLRPGLSGLYDKMAGKSKADQRIWVNKSVCEELLWLTEKMETMSGVRILESEEWGAENADLTLFTDACPGGLGFWVAIGNVTLGQPIRDVWSRERLLYERAVAMGSATDPGTRSSYSSALQSYVTFCRNHNFDIDPSPDTLSFFVVYMSHHIEPKSVESYLSGICNELESFFPDIRKSRSSALVKRTLKGCKRLYSSPASRKRPLRRQELTSVFRSLHSAHSYDDLLFVTILYAGFFGLMRLGELVWPDKKSLRSFRKVIMRDSLVITPSQYEFTLPTHKSDRAFEGNKIIIKFCTNPFIAQI